MDAEMSKVRVLLIDDDPGVLEDLHFFLTSEGFNVISVSTQGERMINEARALAPEFRPHVTTLDINTTGYINREDRSGLLLLSELHSGYCILYSSYLTFEITRLFQELGVEGTWIAKTESVETLLDSVKRGAQKMCASCQALSITWSAPLSLTGMMAAIFPDDPNRPVTMPEDLLSQLFPNNKSLSLEPIGLGGLSSHEVSRGRSVITLVKRNGRIPVVVKFGRSDRLQLERENYEKHVKGRLEGLYCAQLERMGRFWELSGAVYSFIGSNQGALPTFATFYKQTPEPVQILRPLHHFFETVWARHYSSSVPVKENSLFSLYDAALNLSERFSRIETLIETNYADLFTAYTNPLTWMRHNLEQSWLEGVHTAVTHGDLHGDNLFVSNLHAWAIDFERTGPGHNLRDFVELEIDIVLRLTDVPRPLFVELAQTIIAPKHITDQFIVSSRLKADEEAYKALAVIRGLRQIACNVTFPQERGGLMTQYLWGLLFDALFVTTLPLEREQDYRHAFVLASLVCDRLQQKDAFTKTTGE